MYIIGKTGVGKSTVLKNTMAQDIQNAAGFALLDPHGDLVKDVLRLIPLARKEDVIYINPSDTARQPGFNVFEGIGTPEGRHLVASGLISVFKKLWHEFWGPRTEHILRNAVLALLEYPGTTLLDLPRILVDENYRKTVLLYVTDIYVREFWLKEFAKYPARLKAEAIAPIQNKAGAFLGNPFIRNILGQKKSSFDIRKVMDNGKILLANLSKGELGEDTATLLGSLLITRIELAALSRSDTPEEERKDFTLFIDEFHTFTTESLTDMLPEMRKRRLSLVLAHQYLEQIDEKLRAALFGNVGTVIAFRVGARDAEYLAREFYPTFKREDFIRLPTYHIYIKLMIDGVTSKPFSAVTLPPYTTE
ncbi:type IV secretion system DNA-binding domain-containing protein [Desulfobacterota bacterium AH_259_B03_O07]|nr:type IV secretion system DNA-binding domain-containing protein [Desulfobacterota bacterium AH_259_B03_O07]